MRAATLSSVGGSPCLRTQPACQVTSSHRHQLSRLPADEASSMTVAPSRHKEDQACKRLMTLQLRRLRLASTASQNKYSSPQPRTWTPGASAGCRGPRCRAPCASRSSICRTAAGPPLLQPWSCVLAYAQQESVSRSSTPAIQKAQHAKARLRCLARLDRGDARRWQACLRSSLGAVCWPAHSTEPSQKRAREGAREGASSKILCDLVRLARLNRGDADSPLQQPWSCVLACAQH